MDPVTTVCESCGGSRYSEEALSHLYKGKSIVDVLHMSVEDALEFFAENTKIRRHLEALMETGLPWSAPVYAFRRRASACEAGKGASEKGKYLRAG